MKILSVVGARPQFIKLAPMDQAIKDAHHEHIVVHTGQHYDPKMSGEIFEDLGLEEPDINLNVGSGTHGEQTAAMLIGLEKTFLEVNPDVVLVYGDTNSTLAGTLAATKIHLPVAHLEAGLRSFNRRMPEEQNRIVTDHLANLLLAPTQIAVENLTSEGLSKRTILTGDVMLDVCNQVDDHSFNSSVLDGIQNYALATIHRAENTDDQSRLLTILRNINNSGYTTILLAHPRLLAHLSENEKELFSNIRFIEPTPYKKMLRLARRAELIVTDSGGLQKEAFFLGTPCVTVRGETEWSETVKSGWNTLSPDGVVPVGFAAKARKNPRDTSSFGDGTASKAAVEAIQNSFR